MSGVAMASSALPPLFCQNPSLLLHPRHPRYLVLAHANTALAPSAHSSIPHSIAAGRDAFSVRLPSLPAWNRRHKMLATTPLKDSETHDNYQAPLPGAVTFKRSAVQTHFEFGTTLESLGLSKLSSELSRSVALSMGLQVDNKSPDEALATPVVVSVDVSNEGRDLRLDGIVRTAMALRCRRCLGPATERVFANFSLLLTEEPVKQPSQGRIGVVLGDLKGPRLPDEGDEGDEVLDLSLDDKLHFPKCEKQIDISKYIRDTVHLEIPLRALCSSNCKGKCPDCGVNLNMSICECQAKGQVREERTRKDFWGPLEQLKKRIEEQEQVE